MRYVRCLPFLVVFLVVMGCGSSVQEDKGVPPPTTLADTSPAQLNATVGITMGGYDSSTASMTELAIQFIANGRLVLFQKGETLACNGETPTRLTTGYDQHYPTAAVSDQVFTCTYTSGQTAATIHFRMPTAPRILAPVAGTTVTRSTTTPIQFAATGDIAGIVALGGQDKAIAQVTTAGMASVDTSHFAAGPGGITLTQSPKVAEVMAPTFASFRVNATAIAHSDITWA